MKSILPVLLLLFLPLSANAEGVWTHYYSANQILDIICEGDYVWLGTTNGVVKRNRHDGSYVRYTMKDGLAGNSVGALYIDRTGRKWFATEGGLSCFDGGEWETFTDAKGLPLNTITSMTQDHDGVMWFGTVNNGVLCFDGIEWKKYSKSDGLGAIGTGDVEVDKENVKWFTIGYGVASFDGKVWKRYTQEDGLPDAPVWNIAIDGEGVKWLATGSILTSFDGVHFTQYPSDSWSGAISILSIAIDKNDVKWLATYGGGVGSFKDGIWQWLPKVDATKYLNVNNHIAIDANNGKWVSLCNQHSFEFGVACYDGINWKRYTVDDGPAANNVYAIGVDSWNRKYFGTYFQGISSFDGKTWNNPLTLEESGYLFSSIVFDYDGVMWIAVQKLMSMNGVERKSYTYPDGPAEQVNAIAIGPDNWKWFATLGGVVAFNGREWKFWTEADGLANNHLCAIAVDKDNVVWAAAEEGDGGLSSFDGKVWKSYSVQEGLPDIRIHCIAVDLDNVKWFGTGIGLYRYDGVSWQYFTFDGFEREGFPFRNIHAVVVDRNNVKWITSSSSVMSFDGVTWKVYNLSVPYFGANISCAAVDRNNVKWFAGWDMGIISFDDRASTLVQDKVPASYALSNHPNPFNPATTITFSLPSPGRATLAVYSVTGQKIRELVSGRLAAGTHSIVWDGRDGNGRMMSSGIYISRLTVGRNIASRRMALIR